MNPPNTATPPVFDAAGWRESGAEPELWSGGDGDDSMGGYSYSTSSESSSPAELSMGWPDGLSGVVWADVADAQGGRDQSPGVGGLPLAVPAVKRQRPMPPAEVVPASRQPKRVSMSFEQVARELSAGLGTHPPRPHRILEEGRMSADKVPELVGIMFMDNADQRRHRNGDQWRVMGGKHSIALNSEHGVQRRYGQLNLFGSDSVPLTFHTYSFAGKDGASRLGKSALRLWHIVSVTAQKPKPGATLPRAIKPHARSGG
eukprot:COSAG05_NODE_3390_length_2090_cov_2.291457_1_plen_258_part_10